MKKIYTVFIDLEKAYNRIDKESLCNDVEMCGGGGQLLVGVKVFYW